MEIVNSRIDKNTYLKKHVNAIHCTNKFTLLQRKISNILLANAFKDLKEKSSFTITINSLCKQIDFNSNGTKKIKDALRGLMSTVVEWGVLDDSIDLNSTDWIASTMLASVKIKDGVCSYQYSDNLRELFSYPKIYGVINLKTQAQLKSSYGLALYENCSRYKDIKSTPWLSVQDVRKILGALGDTYNHWGSFKKRVLDIALREVNEKTELKVEVTSRKEGRKISYLKFKIAKKIIEIEKLDGDDERASRYIEILITDFGVSRKKACSLLKKQELDYIEEKINYVKNQSCYKEGKIKNLAGYIVKAIEEDYKISSSSSKIKSNEEKEVKKQIHLQKEEDQHSKYKNFIVASVISQFRCLSSDEQNSILHDFTTNAQKVSIKKYEKYGLNNDKVKIDLFYFMHNRKDRYGYLFEDIISYENFIQNDNNLAFNELVSE